MHFYWGGKVVKDILARERAWRNLLIVFCSIFFFAVGVFAGVAWASPSDGRVVGSSGGRVGVYREDFVSVTTTTVDPVEVVLASIEADPVASRVFQAPEDKQEVVLVISSFFPEDPDLWLRIAECESGLDPNAHNASGASGLMQIMFPLHKDMLLDGESPFDPIVNVRIARSLSKNGTDTSPWDASRSCWG